MFTTVILAAIYNALLYVDDPARGDYYLIPVKLSNGKRSIYMYTRERIKNALINMQKVAETMTFEKGFYNFGAFVVKDGRVKYRNATELNVRRQLGAPFATFAADWIDCKAATFESLCYEEMKKVFNDVYTVKLIGGLNNSRTDIIVMDKSTKTLVYRIEVKYLDGRL